MTWFNSSWPYRKKITIAQSQVDADLTDFPVMVELADADVLAESRADMRDVLFTAADGSTQLSHELVKRSVVGVGTWSWFSNPRAIYHNGKTYVASISTSGTLVVTEYNHTTAAVVQTTLTATLQVDDHCHAALMVRGSDSKLVAFYAKHGADTTLRYKISSNATDSTAWGSEKTTTFSGKISYANPIVVDDDSSACYVFTRVIESAGDYRWSYKRTADYSSWGSEVEVWDPGATQNYLIVEKNGTGRIDFFASDGHPSTNGNTSLYHFYAAWDSGTSSLKFYNSTGTVQTLPMDTSKATLVYDGSGGQDGWVHDLIIDSSNLPRVLFQQRVSASGTGDMRIMFSRFNGSAWTTPVEITPSGGYVYSGEPAYCGVSCFDGADDSTIYLGKQVTGVYEMQEWATTDNGATWSKITDITTGSSIGPNLRPVSPKGHTGRLACLWASGTYASYTSYRMNIHCYPPIIKEAHVKVPTVSGSTDTDIYCYYGNLAASDQEDAANAWDSNFLAVYHLEERPSSLSILDSTTNARTGTKKSMVEPAYLGNLNFGNKSGQTFDGTDDYIDLPTGINFAGLTAATVEVVGSYDGSGNSGDEHQFFSNYSATTAAIMVRVEPTAGSNALEVFAIKAGDTQIGGGMGATVSINTLHHIGAVYDATNLRAYLDGTVGSTTYSSGGSALDATASIGAKLGYTPHSTTEGLAGYEEEVRISNVARSAAWLKATSVNLKTPGSFYSVGTEETDNSTTAVDSDLSDSYVLRAAVSSDLADRYAITASVNADLADSYLIRASVAQDLADSYALRASIASDLADSYTIEVAGTVSSDLADSYLIRAAIASDLSDSAAIRAAVLADIADEYTVRSSVSQDLADQYTLINAVQADLDDSYIIRAAVAQDLIDSYTVFSGSGTGATAEEIWAVVMDGSLTASEMMRIMFAALAGKREGIGTATERYYGQDGVTPRITFTPTDANGNGTTVVNGS